jgi:hypothetical protein
MKVKYYSVQVSPGRTDVRMTFLSRLCVTWRLATFQAGVARPVYSDPNYKPKPVTRWGMILGLWFRHKP